MSAGTFQRAGSEVEEMAYGILSEFETHKPLIEAKVKFDLVLAFARVDDSGQKLGWAIKRRGVRALGFARIVDLKNRALGHGDAEITLDGDWWAENAYDLQRALLDHELHHIELKMDPFGGFCVDDLKRPLLRTRPHDYEFGWFTIIAERHGAASQERILARTILDAAGQYYWPELLAGRKSKATRSAAPSSSAPTVTVDMGRKCSRCGMSGAGPAGICISCLSKVVKEHRS